MKSYVFAAMETGGRGLCALPPKLLLLAGITALLVFCTQVASSATTESGFSELPKQAAFALTNPIVLVSPARLDFGSVPGGKRATREFLVENIGRGKLVGT